MFANVWPFILVAIIVIIVIALIVLLVRAAKKRAPRREEQHDEQESELPYPVERILIEPEFIEHDKHQTHRTLPMSRMDIKSVEHFDPDWTKIPARFIEPRPRTVYVDEVYPPLSTAAPLLPSTPIYQEMPSSDDKPAPAEQQDAPVSNDTGSFGGGDSGTFNAPDNSGGDGGGFGGGDSGNFGGDSGSFGGGDSGSF